MTAGRDKILLCAADDRALGQALEKLLIASEPRVETVRTIDLLHVTMDRLDVNTLSITNDPVRGRQTSGPVWTGKKRSAAR